MVRLSVATLTSALLLAALSPLAQALPSPIVFTSNSTDVFARDQLEARYDGMISTAAPLERRYNTNLQGPSGYRYSWGIDGARVSFGTSSGQYITRSAIAGATTVGQAEVNACGAICERTSRCGFFHPVEMRGSSEGNVICALYTTKQDKSAATWKDGPTSTGGTVVASYGFTRDAGAVGGSTLPAPPSGATLVQYKGCTTSSFTIPMFVNKNYPVTRSSSASTAWIVQHGSGRNFNDYFTSLRNVVGDEGVIIAPNFYASSDSGKWYQPTKNLAWNSNDWANGADAVAPAGVGSCSSFDVIDSLVNLLRDRSKFPNLRRVFVVAHSGGASMMAKYGMLKPNTGYKYVLANSPSMPYFTTARPNSPAGCSDFNTWGYGFGSPMPRYVAERNPGGPSAFRNWITQDITLMTADLDTYSRDQSGDQSCPVQAQGGQNRRDRGYAWWAYINLLGGTQTDVSQFYGYQSLKDQGVSSLNPWRFGARYCVVDGVGHDNYAMFSSDCGRAAITGARYLPPGPGPIRPE
ncbi:uncharacterized protein UTRI_06722 [Ustilago trichophora]|uniref:Uncharacterized protein n=1 Tax=Ustilago trichophora TaxID=86804 RepID=A0A5C3EP66_9BASI|nr:uncharacterized protein UTRI_06722 [Ustilago trichophora]